MCKKISLIVIALSLIISAAEPIFAATYRYDELERLTEITFDSGDTVIYTYDSTGNIIDTAFFSAGIPLPAPKITTPPGALENGVVGQYYSVTIATDNIADSFKVTKGSLPDGLQIADNGVISGIPTKTGASHFSITAANSAGTSAEVAFSIRVEVTSNNIPNDGSTTDPGQSSNQNQTGVLEQAHNTEPQTQPLSYDADIARQLQQGDDPVIIITDGVTRIDLTGSALLAILKANKTLTITKDIASLLISPANIFEMSLKPADEIIIDFIPVTTPIAIEQPDTLNNELFKHFYDIIITLNGKKFERFDPPLSIRYDLSDFLLSREQRGKLTGVRYLEENRYNQLGGMFIDDNIFEFKTSFLSIYGVIISETLISIVTTVDKYTYTVNGERKNTDIAPMIINKRAIVPIRFIAEAFGADVEWVAETRSVEINLDGIYLFMTIGIISDGMDVAPFISNNRTMAPLRYISENLGANVVWDEETRIIYLYR